MAVVIPKIFHQFWTGDEMPERFQLFRNTWKYYHPDWEMVLWTEKNLPKLINQELFDEAETPSLKSDLCRYEVLYKYGGVYIDTDFECYANIETIIDDLDCFGCGELPGFISGGFIGSIAQHPIMKELIEKMAINIREYPNEPLNRRTGPYFVTKTIIGTPFEDMIELFPSQYFYPSPYPEDEEIYACQKHPGAFANHHWASSWTKGKDGWK